MRTRHPIALIVFVYAALLSALAQFSQQGPKLVGTGAVGETLQGSSVSLSGDGITAIVGGYQDNNYAGAAWVWTRSGGVWTQPSRPACIPEISPRTDTEAHGSVYTGVRETTRA